MTAVITAASTPRAADIAAARGADDLPTMARMLTALLWRFAVRQPDELAEAVRKHVAALALDLKCT